MNTLYEKIQDIQDRLDSLPAPPVPSAMVTPNQLAGMIDHTLLKPEARISQVVSLCQEAVEYGFASVCVNPIWVPVCAEHLEKHPVPVCTVVGFPLGANTTAIKVTETEQALRDGAREIDMVLAIGQLKSGYYNQVFQDIQAVVDTAAPHPVKVILETCLLTDPEKAAACVVSQEAGAAFVKTSTGFSKAGATTGDVRMMRAIVGSCMGVKAAGGIRDKQTALEMIEAGANRLGASSGVHIIQTFKDKSQ
jgi:deoxyribose-phosphate aldolase